MIRQFISRIFWVAVKLVPFTRPLYETRDTQTPITVKKFISQKVLGFNRKAYWPVHFTSIVTYPEKVYCGVETCPGYMPSCYIPAANKIYIGDYTQIGPGVGIISANHNLYDNRKHVAAKPIIIGKYCWIGMNAVILPGVELGDFTVVAAGSVVSRSFREGYCLIGGNPAEFLLKLDSSLCIKHKSRYEYNGYIRSRSFEKYRKKHLDV